LLLKIFYELDFVQSFLLLEKYNFQDENNQMSNNTKTKISNVHPQFNTSPSYSIVYIILKILCYTETVAQPGGGKWAIAHFIWRFAHRSFYQEVFAHWNFTFSNCFFIFRWDSNCILFLSLVWILHALFL
jgi:hypothetical protein